LPRRADPPVVVPGEVPILGNDVMQDPVPDQFETVLADPLGSAALEISMEIDQFCE